MTVYQAAVDGEYKTAVPYPDRPKKPAILSKVAGDLTPQEIGSLAQVRSEYEAAKTAYAAAAELYGVDQRRLDNKFKTDLEAEYGLTGHPKADLLYSKAYEMGHSSGHAEVANYYGDLAELLK